ncbi:MULTISPECIES: ATP-binding protein [unclassified Sphingomonas]|uniref:ATP-binding protein n=1 Tax=unclassified Sphingomonas TaxID=196159 RepID=UPI00138F403D|nr:MULTISPECIES: ATP-binding protein [unclassified Sphingomonas]
MTDASKKSQSASDAALPDAAPPPPRRRTRSNTMPSKHGTRSRASSAGVMRCVEPDENAVDDCVTGEEPTPNMSSDLTSVSTEAAPAQPALPATPAVPVTAPSSLAQIAGEGMAAFENIVLPTPAQVECIRQMDTLRIMGLSQPAGQQRRAFRYLNQSGSGKSTCAKLLKRHVEGQPGRDPRKKPILHVTLSTTGTPKSLATSILNEVGDGYSTRGEAELLLERVKTALNELEVELLVIDELNHFKQKHLAEDAANTIKNILTMGWVPIVLMGTTDAQTLFTRNRELKNRCLPQVVLQPFVHTDAGSREVWTQFLHQIDLELVGRGVMKELSGLGEPTLAKDLCEASNGLIGEFHNIVLAALEATLLAGERFIGHARLMAAIDAWCIQDGTIDHNPLRLRVGG